MFSEKYLKDRHLFLLAASAIILIVLLVISKSHVIIKICSLISIFLFILCLIYIFFVLMPELHQFKQVLTTMEKEIQKSGSNISFFPSGYNEAETILDQYTQVKISQYRTELIKNQSNLSALQSQINPHFLYNTLDSIRGQALEYDVPEIADMTEALSTYFRYNISGMANVVPLRDELMNIQTYFKIQPFRFENRFTLSVINEDPRALDCYLPKMTLQPIVENSIFHGLEQMPENGKITIRISLTSSRLMISVIDNGIGISKEKLHELQGNLLNNCKTADKPNSIALSNVNERIKLTFGYLYGLEISSQQGIGTEVDVQLPVCNNPEEYNH